MDLHTELARFNPDPALADWVVDAVQTLLDKAQKEAREATEQLARRDTELHSAKTKIQALVLELAHLRRMRFGATSEALSAETRDLM